MKVGIVLAGVSYDNDERNFDHCFPNCSKNLIQSCKKNNNVEVYCVTYDINNSVQKLSELINPKKMLVLDYNTSSQNRTRYEATKLIANEDLDFVILARFDLHYFQQYEDFNFEIDKFNIVSKEGHKNLQDSWTVDRYVNDTFFAYPFSMNYFVNKAFENGGNLTHNHGILHYITPLIGYENIHFMSDIWQLSGSLFASICRSHLVKKHHDHFEIHPEVLQRFRP